MHAESSTFMSVTSVMSGNRKKTISKQTQQKEKYFSIGVVGVSYNWINSYLSGRSNCVRVGFSSSSVISSICGVYQGSVHVPVLFLIYIVSFSHIVSQFNVLQ